MQKSATFFGGAMNNTTTKEYIESIEIGKILAKSGYIVKSGGYRGLMEAVSKGCYIENGKSIGYTVKTFGSIKGNSFLNETIVCDNIYDRLNKLISASDLFIIRVGSVGTYTEFFLTLDILRKTKNDVKIYIFDKKLYDCLDNLNINTELMDKIFFCQNIESFEKIINNKNKTL